MRKKTAVFITAAILIFAAAVAAVRHFSAQRPIAAIISDGKVIDKIDLRKVKESYSFTIETESGSNTVFVEKNGISVSHASCPDKICVNQGTLSPKSTEPIVCLPNKLMINMEREP